MFSVSISKVFKLEYLFLLLIMGAGYYVAFIPHQSYPYALHVDEWVHMARARALLQAGSVSFPDSFSGGMMGIGANLEASFQLFWGIFQSISGMDWQDIFRFFPGVIFLITILSVYIMARREGFGLTAAFFTLLIPTTVGVLGPAFLVPVSMGLLFTPLILFLAFNFRAITSYILIFLLIVFLLAIHAPSAIAPIIVLAPYILLNIKGDFKHSAALLAILLLPFFIVFPWIFSLVIATARGLLSQQAHTEFVQLPRIIQDYGYMPIGFSLLGTFALAYRGGKSRYGLLFGLLALMLMLVSYYSFNYGVAIMYERGLMYAMLMIGIVGGAGLGTISDIKLPHGWLKMPEITDHLGKAAVIIMAGVIIFVSHPDRQETPYYKMIDEADYQAFVWIRDNLPEQSEAILDPWKGTAFSAITGKLVYTRIHMAPLDPDKQAYSFIEKGSTDSDFLRQNNISIVYTRIYNGNTSQNIQFDSQNPDLVEIQPNIYLFKPLNKTD